MFFETDGRITLLADKHLWTQLWTVIVDEMSGLKDLTIGINHFFWQLDQKFNNLHWTEPVKGIRGLKNFEIAIEAREGAIKGERGS